MSELGELEAKLGHRFHRPELLEQALTHGSVRHEQQIGDDADCLCPAEDNERLEFLGDAIVGMVVAELLYRRYPELDEGALTRLRAALVSRKHLGQVGTSLDLGAYLRLGRAEERNGGRKKVVLLANCMEAIIAALYLEGGLQAASAFVERTVTLPYVDGLRDELRENRSIGDYKTALQEWLQSRHAAQPEYVLEAETGPDHRKRFVVQVRVGRSEQVAVAQGEGSTKKKAEQEAARKLYQQLAQGFKGESQPEEARSENNFAADRPQEQQPRESRPLVPEADASPRPAQDQGGKRLSHHGFVARFKNDAGTREVVFPAQRPGALWGKTSEKGRQGEPCRHRSGRSPSGQYFLKDVLMTQPPGTALSSLVTPEAAADPAPSLTAEDPRREPGPGPGTQNQSHLNQYPHHYMLPTLLETLRSLVTMMVVALFLLTFVVQPFRIPSESMERTLLVGDFLLVNKMIYAPRGWFARLLPYRDVSHGDIIVFRFPLDPSDYVVKRVIGLPGDRIHLANGIVYRNGQALREPYAVYEPAYQDNFRDQFPAGLYTDPGVDTHWWLEMRSNLSHGELVVPANSYFVLGDNRNHSRDSRYWGFVPRSNVIGRPFVIYFSLRQPSATDTPTLPDDKLGHDDDPVNGVVDFARWDRMLRIVR